MQIPSRFTIAVHILACISYFDGQYKLTSDFIAGSVGINPVIIRKTIQQLKNAQLIEVKRGEGGAKILKPLEDISLLDVYEAVEPTGDKNLFSFHDSPNPNCPVGKNIHETLNSKLDEVQLEMKKNLFKYKISDIVSEIKLSAGVK